MEVGAGSGFFSGKISDKVGKIGLLIVSDPSSEQLREVNCLKKENIKVVQAGADTLVLEKDIADAIFGLLVQCIIVSTKQRHSKILQES